MLSFPLACAAARVAPLAAWLAIAPLAGCKQDPAAVSERPAALRPRVKKPVDKTPLPPLANSPGGATGKPLWATGFGGLGIDSPRAVAAGPGGDVFVAGYFDGEIDLGPAGKHAAARNAKDKDPKKAP